MQVSASSSPPAVRVVVLAGADLDAIEQIARALPARCGFAVVVACAAGRDVVAALRPSCVLRVEEVRGEALLEHDRVLVLPPDAGVAVQGAPPALRELPGAAWSLDGVLRALAEVIGRDIAAVVLCGPGAEGTAGVEWIREAGGLALAAAAPAGLAAPRPGGEPSPAISAGLVDLALPAAAIATRLVALGRRPARPIPIHDEDEPQAGPAAGVLHDILMMLQDRWGHDFTAYKRIALLRRVERRMQVCETADLAAYQRYLGEHAGELAELRRDLLIKVTSFFRDPGAFEALERRIVPALFEGKSEHDQVRVWVAGCATGEEAYSLAILLAEHARRLRGAPRLRVIATDIDDEALARARAGVYPDAIRMDVPPDRLERHFVREGRRCQIAEAVRAMMLFRQHDVLRDPPFPGLDLISCRNLLIYLERDARERVLDAFHAALRPGGFLFLGSSESADGPSARFDALDAKHRIYARRPSPPPVAPSRDRETEGIVRRFHRLRERLHATIVPGAPNGNPTGEGLRAMPEERLWLALRAARTAVIGLDAAQRVTWGQVPGAERAPPGRATTPAEPSRLLEVFAPGQAARLLELARCTTATHRSVHAEFELMLDGQPRTYDFRIEPAAPGVVAVGFDVTPARLARAALLESERRKDEFLATLSHELRTPLAPLRVALDLAKLAQHDPPELARSLALVEHQVMQLTRLVDDLFDLARIAHGKLALERAPLDPATVVAAAVEAASAMLQEHAHRLQLRYPEAPVQVLGDFQRLVQAVTNLLTNAAMYTPDGGQIDLALQADPQRRVIAIRVRDTGIGITEDALASIFDLFAPRHAPRGGARRSLGVGLHLVRRIVELHGGTVVATSAGEGRGSEFVIELPILEAPPADARARRQP